LNLAISSDFSWAISNIIAIPKLIMNKTYYIGLESHKDTIAAAYISLADSLSGLFCTL